MVGRLVLAAALVTSPSDGRDFESVQGGRTSSSAAVCRAGQGEGARPRAPGVERFEREEVWKCENVKMWKCEKVEVCRDDSDTSTFSHFHISTLPHSQTSQTFPRDAPDCGDSIIKAVKEAFADVEAQAARYAASLRDDGSWADIDYATSTRSAWPAEEHLARLKTMARAAKRGLTAADAADLRGLMSHAESQRRREEDSLRQDSKTGLTGLPFQISDLRFKISGEAQPSKISNHKSQISNGTPVNPVQKSCLALSAPLRLCVRHQTFQTLLPAYRKALAHWLDGGFRNPNWWWNEIGAPLDLGEAAVMMKDALTEEEIGRVVEALRVCRIGMTGMNRVWLAQCVLNRALLEGNRADMEAARDALASEVAVSRGAEGIQRDWSFHQHGNQPQFGNYGASYILSVPPLAARLEALGLGLGDEKRDILVNLVTRGFLPTVWRGRMDVGALGRQLNPGAAAFKGAAVLLAARSLGLEGCEVPEGLHVYPCSAYAVYRAKDWMAAVKCGTASVRGCETVNDENSLGAHLEDGALFLHTDGRDYEDIFPLWNWRRIPGITSYDIDTVDWRNRNRADVFEADGETVRFELDRAGLTARTEWTFSPDGVAVRVTGVTATNDLPVVTTVEQSRARPNATVWEEGSRRWARNGSLLYELPLSARVEVRRARGNWRRHTKAAPDMEAEGAVFEITIPHGVRPRDADCAWRIHPRADGENDE